MSDLLVKLYELDFQQVDCETEFLIKRPLALERQKVCDWVAKEFSETWATELQMAFSGHPVSCFVALSRVDHHIVGFSSYDVTFKGFFGPEGVGPEYRGKGLGKALLLKSLHAMHEVGYRYAIIGGAANIEFYQKCVGAIEIENSSPGAYRDQIRD